MATIFLSYAREDHRFAEMISKVMSEAGHSVWWDREIDGGQEFGAQIEAELERADVVLVAWSKASVRSRWVRDEAAVGGDRGILVPVSIDGSAPPMGFRQFHTLDLTNWRAGDRDERTAELIRSVERRSKPEKKAPRVGFGPPRKRHSLALPGGATLWALASILILAAFGVGYILSNLDEKLSAPVVTVDSADDSLQSRSLADDLFIKLGALQSAKSDALQLVEPRSDVDPNLKFRVAQRNVDGKAQATIALIDAPTGNLLWSSELQSERQSDADLRQQVAYSAALALACAAEAMAPGHDKLRIDTLKLYLSGCARFSRATEGQSFVEIFLKVTQQAPDFEGGWAKLLMAETFLWQSKREPQLGQTLRAHIRQARKLNPTMAEAYMAESWLLETREVNRWMALSEAAVKENPTNVFALTEHSNDMFQVGRLQESVAFARRAVQADPLSPWVRDALFFALIRSGEIEAAADVLQESERLWPGAKNVVDARFFLLSQFGDPGEAVAMLRSGEISRQHFGPATEPYLVARINPTRANIDRAIAEARSGSDRWFVTYIDILAAFDRPDELFEALAKLDPGEEVGPAAVFVPKFRLVHIRSQFMAILSRWGQFEYWQKSGNWPDFCLAPDLPYDCKTEAAKLTRVRA